jgi:hypothetical protein
MEREGISSQDSYEALVWAKKNSEHAESQNHKSIKCYIIQRVIEAYLSPKTTRGQDGDSG